MNSTWPIYYKDKLHIANPNSNVAIITLWTPMQVILPKLNQEHFNIGGQLYSKRGVNFIVRNILANPIIDTLVLCGANLSGSAEALMYLIEKGIDENNNIIGVDKAYIDKEIDLDTLNTLRSQVTFVNLVKNSSAKNIQEHIEKLQKQEVKQWAEPKIFPDPEPFTTEKFPSEKTAYTVRAGYIKEAWPQILRHVMKFGSKKGMIKVGEVKELVNLIVVIEDENPYKPDLPKWFTFNATDLAGYYKNFFAKETHGEDYNYGERIFSHALGIPNQKYNSPNNTKSAKKFSEVFHALGETSPSPSSENNEVLRQKLEELFTGITLNQLEEVYIKLKRYKYDRGGVVTLWNPWTDNIVEGWMADKESKKAGNVPCMTQLQFAYRDHRLHLTAYFRSNDMFDAWPRNAFALRKLQFDLAKKLDLKPGPLTTISSLGQIYEANFEAANSILEKFNNITNCRPDSRGNVLIEVEGKEIVVRHTDTSGNEIMQEFRADGTKPNSAQGMSDILLQNLVFSEMPHAMDIARQLQKAEIAVKNGLRFNQDKDIDLRLNSK